MKIHNYALPGISLSLAVSLSLNAQAITLVDDLLEIKDTNGSSTALVFNNGTTANDQDWVIANNSFGFDAFTITSSTGGGFPSLSIRADGFIGMGALPGFAKLTIGGGSLDTNIAFQANDGGGNDALFFLGVGASLSDFRLVDFSQFDGNFETLLSPLIIEEGAPTDSLFVSAGGKVGLGTSTPGGPLGSNLTVSNSGSGIVNSSIFIDDGLNGWSFGASQDIGAFIAEGFNAYLNILPNGNVGISPGASPEAKLHVGGSNDAKILVKNTAAATGTQVMFNLVNDGGVRFDMRDNSTGSNWVFQNQFGTFDVTLAGTGTREFRFYPNGNLEISGTLLQASSRSIKHAVEPVDPMSVLEKVVSLPVNMWSYDREEGVRHMGPMSEDFYASFGLGGTDKGITTVDAGGVALAAIQGLKHEKDAQLAEKDAQIANLRDRLEQQEDRMLQLELALTEFLRNQSADVLVGSRD